MNFESNQKRVAFGYERNANNKIVLHEIQSAIVEAIFIFYNQGLGFGEIKEKLEKAKYPSPHNGTVWSRQTISNILSNPHYIGDDIYPQIVTKELFDSVQKMKQSK